MPRDYSLEYAEQLVAAIEVLYRDVGRCNPVGGDQDAALLRAGAAMTVAQTALAEYCTLRRVRNAPAGRSAAQTG